MTPTIQELPISQVRRDSGAQFRVKGINPLHATNMSEALERGETLPAIIVFYDNTTYWMGDGDHRIEAHLMRGLTTIAAEVREGTQLDARRFGRGANASHGKPRDTATKKAQVLDALQDPDWKGWSQNAIARECKVSSPFVKTVADENGLTINIYSQDRTYIHNKSGQPTQMNTANLGRRPAEATPQAAPEPPAVSQPDEAPSSLPLPDELQHSQGADQHTTNLYPLDEDEGDFPNQYDTTAEEEGSATDEDEGSQPASPLSSAPDTSTNAAVDASQQAAPTSPAAASGGTLQEAKREEAERARRELEARIEALPLAQALSLYGHSGNLFKEQARLWYENEKVRQVVRYAAGQVRHTTGPFSEAVLQLATVAKYDPSDWEGCAACKGSTRVGERFDPCGRCKGGFTFRKGEGVSAEAVVARAKGQQEAEVK